jgi:F420H(2)-dependent quinone reductase
MAEAHTPFALVNRTVNPLLRALLDSPAHGLVSGHLMLITVTGRRSGRTFTFPVGYHQDGDRLRVNLDWPERKRWWRNLRGGAPVAVLLRGVPRTGVGRVVAGEDGGPSVEIELASELVQARR